MPRFKCDKCEKDYANKGSLGVHKRTHSGERPFQCEVCKKGFFRSDVLTEHIRTHTGDKPFICFLCSQAFKTSGRRTQHMRTHTIEHSHKCLPCGIFFAQSGGLVTHNKNIHSKNGPFLCRICGYRFSQRRYLSRHHCQAAHPSESATQSATVHTHTEPEGMVTVTTQTRVSSGNTTTISTVTSPIGSAYIVTEYTTTTTITTVTQGSGLVTTNTDQNFPGSGFESIFSDKSIDELLRMYHPDPEETFDDIVC